MKLLWFIVAVYLTADVKSGIFVYVEDYRYYISFPLLKNWHQALRYCTYQGQILIAIDSIAENNRVIEAIRLSNKSLITELNEVWMGATDLGETRGKFYWASTGQNVTYTNFYADQPDNIGNNQRCLELQPYMEYHWNDLNCLEKRYFMCRTKTKVNDNFAVS